MTLKILLLCLFLVDSALSTQYIPIAKSLPGIFVGDMSAPVKFQLVYDPMCYDTLEFDKRFTAVLDELDEYAKAKISVRYIPLPLPFHISSHKLVIAMAMIQQQISDVEALRAMKLFLYNILAWNEQKLMKQTINDFIKRVSLEIEANFLIPANQVQLSLMRKSKYASKVKNWSKYAMGVLQSTGTPNMYVNGVKVENGTSMQEEQLRKLIVKLVQ